MQSISYAIYTYAWIIFIPSIMNHIHSCWPVVFFNYMVLSLYFYLRVCLPLFYHFYLKLDARSLPAAVTSCSCLLYSTYWYLSAILTRDLHRKQSLICIFISYISSLDQSEHLDFFFVLIKNK